MDSNNPDILKEKAALIIQKAYRGMAARKIHGPLINKDKTINIETANFIRYYARKWKSKTIFQILLQYRAARYHDLFNFSQQVHLYNQNAFNAINQSNEEVDVNSVDTKANVHFWLGIKKQPILKIPFRLDEIPFYDTSNMCHSLESSIGDLEETWDAPFNLKKQTSNSTDHRNLRPTHKNKSDNKIIDIPFTRDPDDVIEPLPPLSEPKSLKLLKNIPIKYEMTTYTQKHSRNETNIKQKKFIDEYESKITSNKNITNNNNKFTKPANRDFDYIKPNVLKHVPTEAINPINELQKIGKKMNNESGGEAPFNFQGMLRKTNFARDSLKRSTDLLNSVKIRQNESIIYGRSSLKKINTSSSKEKVFSGKIAPGIYMEGIEVDI